MPFPRHPLPDHIHGAAHHFPAGEIPVAPRQSHLGKFCGHAQKSAEPHPENGPGSAKANSPADADDVPGPHRGRQRRAERLKLGHGALLLFWDRQHTECSWQQRDLREARAQAQKQPRTHHHRDPGRPPQEPIHTFQPAHQNPPKKSKSSPSESHIIGTQ